jgi:hypothetical protein
VSLTETAGALGFDSECLSCGEVDVDVCPASRRPCGHHCNHSWTHDNCCWCDKEWGEESEQYAQPLVSPE